MPKKNKSISEDVQTRSDKHRPLDCDEATKWLADTIDFLCGDTKSNKTDLRLNPAIRRAFVGKALRDWMNLKHKDDDALATLLCMRRPVRAKRGRPSIGRDIIIKIAEML